MPLIPSDQQFFVMLDELAGYFASSSALLEELFREPARVAELIQAIREAEYAADGLTRAISQRLEDTFVPPLDPTDIHALATALDGAIDLVEEAAKFVHMFDIAETDEPSRRLTSILRRCGESVAAAVARLQQPDSLHEFVRRTEELEEEGDAVYHRAVTDLFAGTPDPLDVLKRKDIYEALEDAIDLSKRVGGVVESIAIKQS